jgi:hypothetical protein
MDDVVIDRGEPSVPRAYIRDAVIALESVLACPFGQNKCCAVALFISKCQKQ